MQFDAFPTSAQQKQVFLQRLWHQVAALLAEKGESPDTGALSLHESCRVWILDLPPVIEDTKSLAPFRRKIQLWHHQIWRSGEPEFYARSLSVDSPLPEEPPVRLVEVTRSELAGQFKTTLGDLDDPQCADLIGEPPGEDWVVRLLIVPRVDLHAFALIDEGEIRKVVPFRTRPTEELRVIDGESLREEILSRPPAFGVG